jgi:hypothetical protein
MADVLAILSKLPPEAFVDNRKRDGSRRVPECDAPVINVTRGEPGYRPIYTPLTADELNASQGVTPAQREAMLHGSMFGFHTPGADCDRYAADGTPLLTSSPAA